MLKDYHVLAKSEHAGSASKQMQNLLFQSNTRSLPSALLVMFNGSQMVGCCSSLQGLGTCWYESWSLALTLPLTDADF